MKIGDYVKETRTEMKHVNWPSRRQAIAFTVVVIGVSVITAFFLGVFDSLFSTGIRILLDKLIVK